MSLSVYIDNKKKDDTMVTAKKNDSINFTEQQQKCCLSLHYNG